MSSPFHGRRSQPSKQFRPWNQKVMDRATQEKEDYSPSIFSVKQSDEETYHVASVERPESHGGLPGLFIGPTSVCEDTTERPSAAAVAPPMRVDDRQAPEQDQETEKRRHASSPLLTQSDRELAAASAWGHGPLVTDWDHFCAVLVSTTKPTVSDAAVSHEPSAHPSVTNESTAKTHLQSPPRAQVTPLDPKDESIGSMPTSPHLVSSSVTAQPTEPDRMGTSPAHAGQTKHRYSPQELIHLKPHQDELLGRVASQRIGLAISHQDIEQLDQRVRIIRHTYQPPAQDSVGFSQGIPAPIPRSHIPVFDRL
ncbi:hypothetical protein BX666DRAFT_1927695 [Dichotomocladium elegans]|nr:hypothetical protein BX666DRAFT_1927695 [Dichotomocladium elegans]